MDQSPPADPDAPYRRPAAAFTPQLPEISEYWPDAPQRMSPAPDVFDVGTAAVENGGAAALENGGAASAENGRTAAVDDERRSAPPVDPYAQPEPPTLDLGAGMPPVRRQRRGVVAALSVLLLASVGVIVGMVITRPQDGTPTAATPTPVPQDSSAAPQQQDYALSAPVDGLDEASFELVSDTGELTLRTGDLGDDLFRVTATEAVTPRTEVADGAVTLSLDRTGRTGDEGVEVLLNDGVQWTLTLSGGLKRGTLELGGARIEGVDLAGDAARIDLTLPQPDGTLPVRMSGGINQFLVRADQGVPVRIRTREGAGQVRFDGETDDGVARGAAFLTPGWDDSTDRVDLDAVAGVGSLSLGRTDQ